ncbi:hypothetical protein DPMN_133472 [Dreissena polymorpha]|uniref:Uncharacterized protein n=1 Tax=Dreissena polymorpha TaxID=45954 RepID=A0A9D4J9T6_DREPO|nr:hypothetical protein DPMN_133472 [Dreissena polymorpha]
MRRHLSWRLIWIQTVCKGLQNLVPVLKELKPTWSGLSDIKWQLFTLSHHQVDPLIAVHEVLPAPDHAHLAYVHHLRVIWAPWNVK